MPGARAQGRRGRMLKALKCQLVNFEISSESGAITTLEGENLIYDLFLRFQKAEKNAYGDLEKRNAKK